MSGHGGIQATIELSVSRLELTKRYRPEASDFGFRSEVAGLATLGEVVDRSPVTAGWRLVAPRLIDVDERARSMRMSVLEGESYASIGALEPATEAVVSGLVGRALRDFWQLADVPYGDIHLANVLVDVRDRTVGLIDPGCPRVDWYCDHLRTDDWPRSRDRGYLAFIAIVSDTRPERWPGRLRRARRTWQLVRELGLGATTDAEAEAAACARYHLSRLREMQGKQVRRRVVEYIARARLAYAAPTGWPRR